MANITLAGILLDSLGEIDVGAVLKFTHLTTTGSTVAGTQVNLIVPPDGAYSINVEYGEIRIDYTSDRTERFVATVVVNSDSTATSIPELLNASVPPTNAQLLAFQTILADAVAAEAGAVAAEAGAVAAEANLVATQITTTELIASTAVFASDTNISTQGYTTSGDGGSAPWKQNGVTGQTVSQSPAQLGSGLLNDGLGNQWELVVVDSLSVRKVGAILDGSTDDLLSFNAAMASANIVTYDGDSFTSATIQVPANTTLMGTASNVNVINASFLAGPVINIIGSRSFCEKVGVAATGSRLTSSFDNLATGILIGGPDSTSNVLTETSVKNCVVRNQPGHGIYFASQCPGGVVTQNIATECRGHAILFDDGTVLGAPDDRVGIMAVAHNISQSCGGYGLALSPSGGGSCYRLTLDNNEVTDCAWNATEMGAFAQDALTFIGGQNIVYIAGAVNDVNFASTTLNNGNARYAKAQAGNGMVLGGSCLSISLICPRWLLLTKGLVVATNTDGLTIDHPYHGGPTITTGIDFISGTHINSNIKISSATTTTPVNNNSGNIIKVTVDDTKTIYVGTTDKKISEGIESSNTIGGGGISITSSIIDISGEGGIADSISFANVSTASYPIPNSTEFILVNKNSYNITVSNGAGAATTFKTKSGGDLVLGQNQAAAFRTISTIHYEV